MAVTVTAEELERRLYRYFTLNEERVRRALKVMPRQTRDILYLIPIFLNYNSPQIPGFRNSSIPYGIDGFVPNENQRRWLIRQRIDPALKSRGKYSIYGLYVMGSSSSIGQGVKSDLDIWVCISKDIPYYETRLLAEKCHFISAYAKSHGADVNLFVTPENRFTSGEHGTLDTEDCGSAQSLFLLDEFYRTSFRLSGRYISWYLVSQKEESEDYKGALESIYASPKIDRNFWFDFGSLANSSPTEYFGSGLWLLYKGIDSPFKAVLKILLMEVYSWEYPNTTPLAISIRGMVHHYSHYSLKIDAYIMMFKKVEQYLFDKKDEQRLEIVRICFFLKLLEGCKGNLDAKLLSYRRRFIMRLASLWGWSGEKIDLLSNPERWKIGYVRYLEQRLFDTLIKSYRALLGFSIRHGIEYAITSDDAGVLSRKLYAAFDSYPGKINLINRELRALLEETELSFIRPSADSLCGRNWYLYPAAINSMDLLESEVSYSAESIVEVVTWACFNNLLTSRTKCYVGGDSGIISAKKINELAVDIENFMYPNLTHVGEQELQKSRDISYCMVIINFVDDATDHDYVYLSDINEGTALSCGRTKYCLIGSISTISLDSWGEIITTDLPKGEEGIVEMLAMLLRINQNLNIMGTEGILKRIKICSYSKRHNDLIRYDLEAVIRQIFSCKEHPERGYTFYVGRNQFEARMHGDRGITISRKTMFSMRGSDMNVLSRYSMRPEYALQVPSQVDKMATLGVVQYFFEPINKKNLSKSWRIYVVNERNEVYIYKNYTGSRAELVNAINRFYTKHTEEEQASYTRFNLPQYFVLSDDLKSLHPFTIRNKSHNSAMSSSSMIALKNLLSS